MHAHDLDITYEEMKYHKLFKRVSFGIQGWILGHAVTRLVDSFSSKRPSYPHAPRWWSVIGGPNLTWQDHPGAKQGAQVLDLITSHCC